MGLWDWSQHHVVSGYRTLGTCAERRQTVQDPAPALPPEKQSACPLLKCRSCLLLNDGATRLEMISFLDQGINGVPSSIYKHLTQGFRGYHWCDPPHSRHNNYVDSIKEAGLSFCRIELSVVSNAAPVPFDKAGLFCRYAEAAKEFLDNDFLFGGISKS